MNVHTFQLGGNAAEVYEAQKVSAIFRPLAESIIRQVRVHPDDRILDVACGTGIVLRTLAARIPEFTRLAGVDLNAGMLEVARKLSTEASIECEWHRGDVAALPFDPGEFSLCFCQQGLQYFPDKPAALASMQRVLEPGGRLVLSVWSEISPLFSAMGEALKTQVGDEAAARAVAPFAFRDGQAIEELLESAGFSINKALKITIDRIMEPAEVSFPREMAGSPNADVVAKLKPEILADIVSDMANSQAKYARAEGFVIPQTSHLFLCTKSRV